MQGFGQAKRVAALLAVLVTVIKTSEVKCAQEDSNKRKLHFSFITALTGASTSSGGIPVIDFALEQINNDSRLLPNYTLLYKSVLDSQVCHSIEFTCSCPM